MTAACPACGGRLSAWLQVPAGEPSDRREFPLLRCTECGATITEAEVADLITALDEEAE